MAGNNLSPRQKDDWHDVFGANSYVSIKRIKGGLGCIPKD